MITKITSASIKKAFLWISFALVAILVGLYPLIYYLVDMRNKGLLAAKQDLIHDPLWYTLFYIHITFGGVALLIGWQQFSSKLRLRFTNAHRRLGKAYVAAVFLSGGAGLYIACFAEGELISQLGFGFLAVLWLCSNVIAYTAILQGRVNKHEKWMIRNYALTFAAVTLRIYLPVMTSVLKIDEGFAYHLVSWLSWVPNLIFAQYIIQRKFS